MVPLRFAFVRHPPYIMPHFDEAIEIRMAEEAEAARIEAFRAHAARSHAERGARLESKNRRKRYLDLHPEYFGPELELADPLLYDRLIRRFQTAGEREAETAATGRSASLAANLAHVAAKSEALARAPDPGSLYGYARGPRGEILPERDFEVPRDAAEGRAMWVDEMRLRFFRGADDAFDYKAVDADDRYDDPELDRDAQDAWFDSCDPATESDGEGGRRDVGAGTGVQDY